MSGTQQLVRLFNFEHRSSCPPISLTFAELFHSCMVLRLKLTSPTSILTNPVSEYANQQGLPRLDSMQTPLDIHNFHDFEF